MSGADESEKSFEPTPKKLEDARKKGEVAKSADLATAAAYGGFLLASLAVGAPVVQQLATFLMTLLAGPDRLALEVFGTGGPLQRELMVAVAAGSWPWFLFPAVAAILAFLAQRAVVFAPSKLVPKLSRISPIESARQKFGRAGLFEFFKSFLKLVIYSVVLGVYLASRLPRIMTTMQLAPKQVAAELGHLSLGLLGIVLVVSVVLGVLDAVFQHAEHIRKNRMSRQELTDELKQSEGDPMMKHQRREKAIGVAMQKMLTDVPRADVVIVNPTHFAVALKWDRRSPGAPVCVAKGVDEIALRIREIAAAEGIPVRSDPPTARALHAEVEVGQEISPTHYRAVAAAIRFAEHLRGKARGK
ncbi:EscU/YscU/HrcU family type III secretion system export apparatus switch protein [Histidinibacterium lentulum]|uniref:Flagellar biosynthesis protein FlhB n=1 Tax=Histidinibacterium lentulum TaxID=2480588 RepID=A0A3N2R6X3_9RHOB|nr:flagellar type III secretion system protein FlhB [Histidinibacterium lentulum]ROU03242.1 flagellar biosynthesis protein FlhB [Histidinibacterium lentulum]